VWFDDWVLAETLVRYSELAREHLDLRGDKIRLHDAAAFEEILRAAKLEKSEGDRRAIVADLSSHNADSLKGMKKKGRLEANERLAKLWKTQSPKLSLGGVKISVSEASAAGLQQEDIDRNSEDIFSRTRLKTLAKL
jgi:hypothetical protein